MASRFIQLSLVSFSFSLLAACSGGGAGSSGALGRDQTALMPAPGFDENASEVSVLASVEESYGTVSFYEAKHDDGTVSTSVGQDTADEGAVTPLTIAAEGHTTLEVYLALVPAGEVPQALLDTHATEALELGRSHDDLVATELGADGSTLKTTMAPGKTPVNPGAGKAPVAPKPAEPKPSNPPGKVPPDDSVGKNPTGTIAKPVPKPVQPKPPGQLTPVPVQPKPPQQPKPVPVPKPPIEVTKPAPKPPIDGGGKAP